ncbi:MAG: hypothetical protein HKN26_02640 [Acidimicrobiales bacterium]|nr:hypothetical protein [Acidimicrobiales bacterium]
MRRVSARLGVLAASLLALSGALLAMVLAAAAPVAAQTDGEADTSSAPPGFVDIIEVDGLLDPVLADFIERSLDEAEEDGAQTLVLQVDSEGSVISDERLVELTERIAASPVSVVAWVGPSGAKLRGGTAQLAAAFDIRGISGGSSIGDLGVTIVDPELIAAAYGDQVPRLRSRSLGYDDAGQTGIAMQAPTIGDFLIALPGFETEQVTGEDGQTRLQPITVSRFGALSLLDQLFHTMASPAVAYLLLIIGLGLLVFELFTAGIGVAGVVGAGFFLGGCYGLAVLPTRPWAIALLVGCALAFAIDIQTGVPRFWTAAGTVMLIIGTFWLYDGVSLPWLTAVVGIGGMLIAMINGMPAMVRTRFSTPTIGREWMVGEQGVAVDAIDPEGTVRVRDSVWRARTNRATPIAAGDSLEVIEVDGLLLEVAPLEGAARDYRERATAPDA